MMHQEIEELRGIKEIIEEAKLCLENKLFLAALYLCLNIQDIMGNIYYETNKVGERFIKWFDENIGQYESTDSKTPHLSGELCYKLRNAILHAGNNDITGSNKNFVLDDFYFYVSPEESPTTFGSDFISYKNDNSGTVQDVEIGIDIKNFCLKIIYVAES